VLITGSPGSCWGDRSTKRLVATRESLIVITRIFLNCKTGSRNANPALFSKPLLFDPRLELINYCRACLAHNFILGIRASRTTDCADNIALLGQWNAASRCNDSIEREQIVEMHKLDTVLEDLRWPPEGHSCSRFVLRNLNGGKHRAVHSFEGN
jgi:hypothetical protein